MARMRVRTWDKPEPGKKALATTGNGSQYVVDGTSGTWTLARTNAQQAEKILRGEFERKGWSPKTLKVREVRDHPLADPKERGTFFLNLGYLRGLDPDEVYRTLKRLPDRCGHRRILEAVSRLEQRVEAPRPQLMSGPFSEPDGEEPTPEQTGT